MRRRLAHSAAHLWLCLAFATLFSATGTAHGRIKHSHDKLAKPAVARTVAVQPAIAAEPAVAAEGETRRAVTTAAVAAPAVISSIREAASIAEFEDAARVGHPRDPDATGPGARLPSLSEARPGEVLACRRGHANAGVEQAPRVWLSALSGVKRDSCSDGLGCCCQGSTSCAGCGMSCCSGAVPPSPLTQAYVDGRQARWFLAVMCDGITVGPADRPPVGI